MLHRGSSPPQAEGVEGWAPLKWRAGREAKCQRSGCSRSGSTREVELVTQMELGVSVYDNL